VGGGGDLPFACRVRPNRPSSPDALNAGVMQPTAISETSNVEFSFFSGVPSSLQPLELRFICVPDPFDHGLFGPGSK